MKNFSLIFSHRFTNLGKEFFLVSLGQGIAVFAGLIGVRLMTGYLSPQSYGEISLVLTFTTLTQQLFVGPFAGAILRYFPIAKEKDELYEFYKGVNFLINWSILLIFLFGFVFVAVALTSGFQNRLFLLFITMIYSVIFGLNVYFDHLQNAARKRLVVAWHQGISQWLRYAITIGIVITFGSSSDSALAGFTITSFFVLMSQLFFLRKQLNYRWSFPRFSTIKISDSWINKILNYAYPFILWGLFTWGQLASDRWALERFQSTELVGYYAVLYQLGYFPMIFLNQIVVQFISPIFFQKAGDGTDLSRIQETEKITKKLVLVSLCLTFLSAGIAYLLSEQLFRILVAPEYYSIHVFLPLMVLSGGIFASAQIYAMIPLNENNPKVLIAPKIWTAMFGTLLNVLATLKFGLIGVIISGIIFSTSYLLSVYITTKKKDIVHE